MGMNIKNEEAHKLALEISKQTGETITATVLRALKLLKDQELKRSKTPDEKMAALRRIDRDFPIPKGLNTITDDDLYDEFGAPR